MVCLIVFLPLESEVLPCGRTVNTGFLQLVLLTLQRFQGTRSLEPPEHLTEKCIRQNFSFLASAREEKLI